MSQLVTNEIYHVVLRGVGDTKTFKDDDDYYRMIFSIYEFNNCIPVNMWNRRKERLYEKRQIGADSPTRQQRDMFVEILAFCFMPNHIHLLVRQLKDNSISQFMQKVGTGYANYFNKKYARRGHLFNRFKAVLIKDDDQLRNVFAYIHCNPISLIAVNYETTLT